MSDMIVEEQQQQGKTQVPLVRDSERQVGESCRDCAAAATVKEEVCERGGSLQKMNVKMGNQENEVA